MAARARLCATGASPPRRGAPVLRRLAAATAVPLLAHAAPSTAVLATFLPPGAWSFLPPALPGGSCRFAGRRRGDGVALTFDDGPSPASGQTLELLDRLGLRATFFLVGEQAAANPGAVAEIAARGHEVALHGMTHRHHLLAGPRAVLADLATGIAVLEAAGAPRPRFFRPPYGQLAAASMLAARRLGLSTVLWTRWGAEFAARTTARSALARLERGLRPGAVLLLHDSDAYAAAGTAARTHELLPALAEALASRSLRTVPMAELVGVTGLEGAGSAGGLR